MAAQRSGWPAAWLWQDSLPSSARVASKRTHPCAKGGQAHPAVGRGQISLSCV